MPAKMFGRRTALSVLVLGLCTGLLLLEGSSLGQIKKKNPPIFEQPEMPPPGSGSSSLYSAVKLVNDPKLAGVVSASRDYIATEKWGLVIDALQRQILDKDGNAYVQLREKDANGRESVRWTSVRIEANNLLGTLNEDGLIAYELECGTKARDKLNEAKKKGDRDLVARVAQQYMHTKAGIEANDLLATFYLDRGEYFVAALRLEKILDMKPERTKLSDLTLFKAALAFSRTGDKKRFDEVWKRLEPGLTKNGGLKIGDQLVAVARLKEVLDDNSVQPDFTNPYDWTTIRGNQQNCAQANGSQPALDYTMFPPRPTVMEGEREDGGIVASQLLDSVIRDQQSRGEPILSGFFPIVINKMVIFRTHKDIHAVALFKMNDGKHEFSPGETVWRAGGDNSLEAVMGNKNLKSTLESFLSVFGGVPGYRSLVYDNSLIGTISTYNGLVYGVEDLAIPAAPNLMNYLNQQNGLNVKPRVLQNVLSAFDVNTGRYVWKLGKWSFDTNSADADEERDNQFANSHFLSVPMSVGGKLYVLNEKNGDEKGPSLTGDSTLRLVCINPDKEKVKKGRPEVIMVQDIGTIAQPYRFTHDPIRRTSAAHMAYGEGIIVCTTNAGEVLGVDILSRGLAWSYPYREQMPSSQPLDIGRPGFQPGFPGGVRQPIAALTLPTWKASPPVIQDGKIVFTAPDATSIHCINLRDGTPLWKKKFQEGDLFLGGVFSGKVVIVNKNNVRVLSLSDGAQLWQEPTLGIPAGQGVASKNVYYLPLKKNDKSDRSEIVAFDLVNLKVKSRNPAVTSKEELGNLLFHEGMVLSQTPLSLTAYPELKIQLDIATKEVEADPSNAVSLYKRGKWLLADGRVQPAVEDIRQALKKELPAEMKVEARRKLFLAMTELMQTSFSDASAKYLEEYKELCNVPGEKADQQAEQQERLARYFRTVGEGYESVENLVDAFQMYREFGALKIHQENGYVVSAEDPSYKVPTNVWLRGRIAHMMGAARDEKKAPLERKIAEEWKTVKAQKDVDAIRAFVGMFDVPVGVGREARLHLAENIIEREDKELYLEAELNLQQLRGSVYFTDVPASARALADLGRLEEKKKTPDAMRLAAMYYRELRRSYPEVLLPDGRTGKDLLDDLTTNPLFLPMLEEPGPLWTNEKFESRKVTKFGAGQTGFVFQPEGDLTPLMKNTRLLLDTNTLPRKLHCYNFGTDTVRWTVDLMGREPGGDQVFSVLYAGSQPNGKYEPNARFRFYQVRGNLAVIQVGTMAYGLNMDAGKILWQQNLFEPPANPNMNMLPATLDSDGNLEIVYRNFNGQSVNAMVGHVGAVQASYVALMTPKGLVVVDPLRGTPLWRKTDVPLTTRVFGDDQCLFTVEMANGAVGAGRAYQAIDGAAKNVPDFGPLYQGRIRVIGRKLLVSQIDAGGQKALKLYDVITGKEVWSKAFSARATVLATEDVGITGVIEPSGQATVLDAETGKILFQNILQAKARPVSADEMSNLEEPLLLQDRDRFYFALNQPSVVRFGEVHNNFANGLRCRPVNGWVLSFFREDGQHLYDGKLVAHKKGDFDWCSPHRIENQLVIVEQFENLPVMVFTARQVVGQNSISSTLALHRANGKRIYSNVVNRPGQLPFTPQGSAPFSTFVIDTKDGAINLIGLRSSDDSLQILVNDGRDRPLPPGAALAAAGNGAVVDMVDWGMPVGGFGPNGGFGPGIFVPGGPPGMFPPAPPPFPGR